MMKKYNTGFGLIEVLVCALIIGMVGLTLARMQGVFSLNNSIAAQRNEATMLAQSRMDQIRRFIDTHNQLIKDETIDNGSQVDLISESAHQGKTAQFTSKICIKKSESEANCRTSKADLTFAEKDILIIQSTTEWDDITKKDGKQSTTLVTKIQKPVAPWPNPICAWANTNSYKKGMYAWHTASTNKKDVWLCNKNGGCGTAIPDTTTGWLDVGQFSVTGVKETAANCVTLNPDGGPKVATAATPAPTSTPTATSTPTSTPTGGANAWEDGKTYNVGAKATYKGNTYECIQGHTAWLGAGWTPEAVSSMWKKI